MSTTVTYKGNTITTAENQTRTLKTAGKYMEGDVIITDVTSGGGGGNAERQLVCENTIMYAYGYEYMAHCIGVPFEFDDDPKTYEFIMCISGLNDDMLGVSVQGTLEIRSVMTLSESGGTYTYDFSNPMSTGGMYLYSDYASEEVGYFLNASPAMGCAIGSNLKPNAIGVSNPNYIDAYYYDENTGLMEFTQLNVPEGAVCESLYVTKYSTT